MKKFFDTVIAGTGADKGAPVSGASVAIYTSTGALASLYSDDGVTPTSNPVTTDNLGYYEFYVADGNYTRTITYGTASISTPDIEIISSENLPRAVASRDDMADVDGSVVKSVTLAEGGRSGTFAWDGSDLSALVVVDTTRAIYVPPTSDASGASGAWVRIVDGPWLAEWFGSTGDGTANDTSALEAMGDLAAAVGSLHWLALPGKIYTTTNPFFLSGIAGGVRIDGYGAKLRNIRGTLGMAGGFVVNNIALAFGDVFSTNGREIYGGSGTPNEYGQLVEDVAAGSTTIVLKAGEVSQMVIGKMATIYGYSRETGSGHPPNPMFFEQVMVTGISGQNITISRPLEFSYYSDWPEISSQGDFTGPARIISHSRPGFEAIDTIEINGLTFSADPGWVGGTSTPARNGRFQVAGYHKCTLNSVYGEGGQYISQGGRYFDRGSTWANGTEPDKVVTSVDIDGVTYHARFEAGTGVRNMTLNNVYAHDFGGLCAIDNLSLNKVRTGSSPSGASIISDTVGTKNIVIADSSFAALQSNNMWLYGAPVRTAAVTVVDSTTIDMDKADFITSVWFRSIFPGSVLYNAAAQPAFVVSGMPREAAGRVFITGRFIRSVSTNDVLAVPYIGSFTSRNVSYTGPYKRAIRDINGIANAIAPTRIAGDDRSMGRWLIDSSKFQITTTARYHSLGPSVLPTRMVINVSQAYSGATGSVILQIRRASNGTVFAQIDLKEVGTRVLDLSGETGAVGSDTLTGIGTTEVYAIQYATTGAVAYASDDEEAVWSIVMEGVPV